MRGMKAFLKAKCHQCHVVSGHGIGLGPELTKVSERFRGRKLLRQILEPSHEIHDQYRVYVFEMENGRLVTGTIQDEDEQVVRVLTNLLDPDSVVSLSKDEIVERAASRTSSMPEGLLNALEQQEIVDLVNYLEVGGYQVPHHLKHDH